MARLISPSRPNKKRRYDPNAPVYYSSRTRRHRYASNYFKPYYTASKRDYEQAWKHIAVYRYPFSRRNLQPKIPDGKTLVSLGFQNKVSTNITLPNNAQPTDILLFPGLSCYCVIKNADGLTTKKMADPTENEKKPTYHTLSTRDIVRWNVETAGNLSTWSQLEGSEIHKWRVVSAGIKFDLTNNAEENDGYWRACRISTPADASDYQQENITANQPRAAVLYPVKGFEITDEEMTNLPSHVQGVLRKISKFEFHLRPEGNDHDFVQLRGDHKLNADEDISNTGEVSMPYTSADVPSITGRAVDTSFRLDTPNSHNWVNQFIDPGWDSILIRIYGRNTMTNTGAKTQLNLEIAMNHEVIYTERSLNSRFHTRSVKYPAFEREKYKKTQKVSAATSKPTKTKTS